MGKSVWKLLTSVKLAITLGIAILLSAMVATFLRQETADAMIYHAPWFLAILGAFSINLLACSINRFRFLRAATFGSFISHIGALTILAGAAIGGLWGFEGYTQFPMPEGKAINVVASNDWWMASAYVDELTHKQKHPNGQLMPDEMRQLLVSQEYLGKHKDEMVKLPFSMVLEKFSLDYYPPEILFTDMKRKKQESHMAKEGEEIQTNVEGVSFKVMKIFKDYQATQEVTERTGGAPAVQLEVLNSKGVPVNNGWLYGPSEETNAVHFHSSTERLVYKGILSAKPIRSDKGKEEECVEITMRREGITKKIPVEIDLLQKISETYSVKIERATLDYAHLDDPDLQPINPALYVSIVGPAGEEKRWVFSKHPDFAHNIKDDNVAVRYIRPGDGPRNIEIYTLPDGNAYVHYLFLPKSNTERLLPVGEAADLNTEGYRVKVMKFFASAEVAYREVDGGRENGKEVFKALVHTPSGDEECTVAKDGHQEIADGAYLLSYESAIKSYDSKIKVLEDGKETASHVVALNNPLRHMGWSVYQNASKPNGGDWLPCLRVTKDPGKPLVYIGFGILSLGLLYASFVRPLLRRSAK